MSHKKAQSRSYIALLLLGLLCVQLNAQERKKQLTREQKEAANLARRERHLQLISYLDGIAQKAGVIERVEDRINVLIEVSDAFWFLDKQRAIASFTQLFQTIENMDSEPGAQINRNNLRQLVLARVARRDPELAAKLFSNDSPSRPVDKVSHELNAESTPYADTLAAVAISLLKTDLQQSIVLARLSTREGMSQISRQYLLQLRVIDQAAADSLAALSLKHAATRSPARLFDVLTFWDYAFQPGGFHFGPLAWPRDADAPSYEVSQSLKLAVLQFAVPAINQNIQLRLARNESDPKTANFHSAQLYSVIQQLLPDITVYMPRVADSLRAELAVLEQVLRGSGQRFPSVRSFGATPEQTNRAVESLLQKAEQMGAGKERDELYLAAAYRLLFSGQFEKAASMAARIDELEMKSPIADAINFNWTGSLLTAGNTAEALTVARTIRAQEPKILALAKTGTVVAAKGDAIAAEEIFNESQTLASKETPSTIIGAAVLGIAFTRAKVQRDPTKAFEALSLAISIINKTSADTVHWQTLYAQSTANPLKVSSLNAVPSSGGGMKLIRVHYPRLAGLIEVFVEASKHDLHQAMRVAQDLSSKPLSLALQASVCRTSAERLAQEERE